MKFKSRISKRKESGIYYYWYKTRSGKERKKSLNTKNIKEARKLKAKEDKIRKKDFKYSINELFESFLEIKKGNIKKISMERYKQILNNFKKFFKRVKIDFVYDLEFDSIIKYKKYREQYGISSGTIKKEISIFKTIFKTFKQEEFVKKLDEIHFPKIKIVPARPERIGSYSKEHLLKLKRYLMENKKDFYECFLFLIFTGMRIGEARKILKEYYDPETSFLKIRNYKTESNVENMYRYIEINDILKPIIIKRHSNESSDYLFPELINNSKNWARNTLLESCKKIDIPYKRLHGLRHSFISMMLNENVAVRFVQEMVGHKNMNTTMRYSHVSQKELKGQIRKIKL